MPKGSVLFSSRAPIGYVVIAAKEMSTNQGFKSIIPNEKIISEYLYYFLKASKQKAEKVASGTTFKEISLKSFAELEIPLPSTSEQANIVSKIEELFSELDKGIEELKTAQQQLKVYRQVVLKWAFEGKLTNKDVKEGELPKSWKLVKTKDVIEIINNGYTPTKEFLSEGSGEVPFIKVYNLNFNGTLNFAKNPTFIPAAIHQKELKRSICLPGDVLINIVGPPLGKLSIVTNQYPEWNINQAIVMFRANEKVLSKYLSYFLQNPVTINWLEGTSKATAGQWNVKVSTCREIPFPICSVEEQQQIVEEIESRLSVCDKIEETITNSLKQSEALRQSILKKAFEGKLI
jgi:restriction endonuclease S subunit